MSHHVGVIKQRLKFHLSRTGRWVSGVVMCPGKTCPAPSPALTLPAVSIYVINTPISSYQAYYFDRDDQALHNFAKFFRNQSHEEREHAEKLMKMQNQRGGRIFLQEVRVGVKHLSEFGFFLPQKTGV